MDRFNRTALAPKIAVIAVGTALAIAAIGVFGWHLRALGQEQDRAWQRYARDAVKISTAIESLSAHLGYGGFIHNFKNYILRGQPSYAEAAAADLNAVASDLDVLDAELSDAELLAAVAQIRRTFDEYGDRLRRAIAERGTMTSEQIDALVKVDDAAALHALGLLSASAEMAMERQLASADTLSRRLDAFLNGGVLIFVLLAAGGSGLAIAIAKQTKLARQLEQVNQEVTVLLRAAPDAVVYVDEAGLIDFANDQTASVLGYDPKELRGVPVDTIVPDAARLAHFAYRTGFLPEPPPGATRSARELVATAKDGSKIPVSISLNAIRRDGKPLVIAAIRDASAHRSRLTALSTELARQLEIAEAANTSKSRFLAHMSHELRTPLNAIIGFTDTIRILGIEKLGTAKTLEYLEDINRSGAYLLDLINDILDISKIEDESLPIELIAADPGTILDDVLRTIKPIRKAKRIALRTEIEPTGTVLCDRRAMQQCLLNLLSNAIKYSEWGATVTVRVQRSGPRVRFEVHDDGPGIPAEVLDNVGQPFLRSSDPAVASIEGTGMGLAITKRLMDSQGGDLAIESELGWGTTAVLAIPVDPNGTKDTQPLRPSWTQSATL